MLSLSLSLSLSDCCRRSGQVAETMEIRRSEAGTRKKHGEELDRQDVAVTPLCRYQEANTRANNTKAQRTNTRTNTRCQNTATLHSKQRGRRRQHISTSASSEFLCNCVRCIRHSRSSRGFPRVVSVISSVLKHIASKNTSHYESANSSPHSSSMETSMHRSL